MDFADGDGWVSDESEFYGTPDNRERLEAKSDRISILQLIREWHSFQKVSPMAAIRRASPQKHVERVIHNRFECNMAARQLSETIPQFLKRQPPLTANGDGAWIWIDNPVVHGQGNGTRNGGKQVECNLDGFIKQSSLLIEQFQADKRKVEGELVGRLQSTITRKLGPFRDQLKKSILDTAVQNGVTSGKWMLFPTEENMTSTWRTICEAIIDDRLGTTAKVAIANHSRNSSDKAISRRLICVYTRDFSDIDDVMRVLEELVTLGLAPSEGNGIYYKCDAYTYLGIESDNPYKLKASLYSSKDMLAMSTTARKMKSADMAEDEGSLHSWVF